MQTDKRQSLGKIKKELMSQCDDIYSDGDIGNTVTIKVSGIQTVSETAESIDILTRGEYKLADDKYFIHYYEELADEDIGSDVDIVYSPQDNRVSMQRSGSVTADLTIENGRRHMCKYNTPYGLIMLGITCSEIVSSLNKNGGTLMFEYSLDINSTLISKNRVDIAIIPD